jgi:hypothetical protein
LRFLRDFKAFQIGLKMALLLKIIFNKYVHQVLVYAAKFIPAGKFYEEQWNYAGNPQKKWKTDIYLHVPESVRGNNL